LQERLRESEMVPSDLCFLLPCFAGTNIRAGTNYRGYARSYSSRSDEPLVIDDPIASGCRASATGIANFWAEYDFAAAVWAPIPVGCGCVWGLRTRYSTSRPVLGAAAPHRYDCLDATTEPSPAQLYGTRGCVPHIGVTAEAPQPVTDQTSLTVPVYACRRTVMRAELAGQFLRLDPAGLQAAGILPGNVADVVKITRPAGMWDAVLNLAQIAL